MSISLSGVKAHDDALLRAENARQVSTAGATQAAVISADVTFHRAVVKSALANGVSTSASMAALRELGVTGQ